MILVAISDVHLDACTLGVPRAAESKAAIEFSVNHALGHGADAWCFLGDLFDPDCGAQAYGHLEFMAGQCRRLAEEGIHSLLLAGNHDVYEDSAGGTVLSPLKEMWPKYVHVLDEPQVLDLDQPKGRSNRPRIIALPFTPACRPYDPAAFLRGALDDQRQNIVLSHLHIPGIIPGEETTEMPRGREVMLPLELLARPDVLAISGHYHRRQVHEHMGAKVQIVGSPTVFTFGEQDNEPTFLEIEL